MCIYVFVAGRGRGRGRRRGRGCARGRGASATTSTSSADHQQRSSLTQPPTSNWKSGSTDITELQFTGTPGLQVPVPLTALEYVQLFTLTDSDFEYIAKETNRYAEQFFAKTPIESLPPHSRLRAWKDTNEDELKLFFALVIAMGLVVKPTLEDYWSLDEVLETPFFGTVMTRNRFELIFKFLHAADNEKAKKRGEDGYDPVYRIREMNNRYLDRCRNVYVPERDLALDEAAMLWKGHISYRVYNPKKPAKFGVKIYEVCVFQATWLTGKCIQARLQSPRSTGTPIVSCLTFFEINSVVWATDSTWIATTAAQSCFQTCLSTKLLLLEQLCQQERECLRKPKR